jgi:DNA-binding NarL/FixJ family response regulator
MTDSSAARSLPTIAILSSQYLVRLGLQKIFENHATVQRVTSPHQWRTADRCPTESHPDVVILDMNTGCDVIGIIAQIRESTPTCKIVLLCGLQEQDRTREAFVLGVDGIVLNVQPPAVVLAVIEALCVPEKPLSHYMERDGLGRMGPETSLKKQVEAVPLMPVWPNALTEREREIIRLVGQGLSNKDIAYTLSISNSTVRHHMTNIFDKVGVPNRQKLLVHAHQGCSTLI